MGSLADALRAFAFSLPEAYEDHPWGESVAKVGKKVFVFFGSTHEPDEPLGFSVKLPLSSDEALAMPFTRPTGYGLDRGSWVTVRPPDDTPTELLLGWIEESYRTVAPRALVAQLDAEQPTR
ncbi:MAG TPA: MmcQ/YjbR family DNA-binding protein [Candidatus Saccharimonadales bacterium]|nr:MmcQ/YjbR family DNA-binding protein [Candidatus Saccharimonadales bacterium]